MQIYVIFLNLYCILTIAVIVVFCREVGDMSFGLDVVVYLWRLGRMRGPTGMAIW